MKISRSPAYFHEKADGDRGIFRFCPLPVSFFLSLILAVFLCPLPGHSAVSKDFDVYKTIPDQKSLLTSPQFLVIDDFNHQELVNLRGARWQTKVPAIGALDLVQIKEDARNSERGYSMQAKFNLRKQEKATFQSLLNRMDVSQAEAVVFKCRLKLSGGGELFPGKIKLVLSDWRQDAASYDFSGSCPADEKWHDVILPMELLKGADRDQLLLMQWVFETSEKSAKGIFQIDEIAFFGFNDVAFESLRDNLTGYPKIVLNGARKQELLETKSDKKFLMKIAEDTWRYFDNARDKETQLIVDHLRTGDSPMAADYTSPTNIAMDLMGAVAAYDLRIISEEKAVDRVRTVLKTLQRMPKYLGLFYNFYDTKRLAPTRSYISSVDNGWLAIALVVVRQAFPSVAGEANKILDGFHFSEFLDPENNQLIVGFDVPRDAFGKYHYGQLVSEARATSLYAIGKGDIPSMHWYFLFRTLPESWNWQMQKPEGKMVTREGIDYFQGYYRHGDKKFVPSWGGSLFEFLMPTLVLHEKKLAPKGLGLNSRIATEIQRDYALIEKGYPVWGISPAATSSGVRWKYEELGVKALASKGYPDKGIMTPHVSFLALETLPGEAIENLRRFLNYEIYGEYGFYDTVNVRNGRVNTQYLALDQGMSLLAICNYLKKDSIKNRFHQDPVGKKIEPLLAEDFFGTGE